MIEIGRKKFPNIDLRYIDNIQNYSPKEKFDCVIANMVLHDIKNIIPVIEKLILLVKKSGRIALSIPHPCFYTEHSQKYFDGKTRLLEIEKYKSFETFYYFNSDSEQGVRIYRRTLTYYLKMFLSRSCVLIYFEEIFKKNKQSEIPFAALFVFEKYGNP